MNGGTPLISRNLKSAPIRRGVFKKTVGYVEGPRRRISVNWQGETLGLVGESGAAVDLGRPYAPAGAGRRRAFQGRKPVQQLAEDPAKSGGRFRSSFRIPYGSLNLG